MVVFTHDGSVNERTTRSDLVEMKWLNFATPDDKVSDSLQQRNPFACKEQSLDKLGYVTFQTRSSNLGGFQIKLIPDLGS